MTIITNFQLLANFNTWVNTKIFSACKELDDKEYRKDRKAFFSSIHGTLNHLLLVDRAYISRIKKIDHVFKAIEKFGDDVTLIIFAHRITTLKNCSRILELSNEGKIYEKAYSDIASHGNQVAYHNRVKRR